MLRREEWLHRYVGLLYFTSVADPVSGPFLTLGSGIGKKIKIREEHPGLYFRELRNSFSVFWVNNSKILKFFDADMDPGSGIYFEPGSGIEKFGSGIKHPGSATLILIDYSTQTVTNWTVQWQKGEFNWSVCAGKCAH